MKDTFKNITLLLMSYCVLLLLPRELNFFSYAILGVSVFLFCIGYFRMDSIDIIISSTRNPSGTRSDWRRGKGMWCGWCFCRVDASRRSGRRNGMNENGARGSSIRRARRSVGWIRCEGSMSRLCRNARMKTIDLVSFIHCL